MNENEILDNPNIEDVNIEVELEELIQNGSDEILESSSLSEELDTDITLSEKNTTIDDAIDENIDTLEQIESENEHDINFDVEEESESASESIDESIENEDNELDQELSLDNLDNPEDEEDDSVLENTILEDEIEELSEENNSEDFDIATEDESIEEHTEVEEQLAEEIEDESLDLVIEEDIVSEECSSSLHQDENIITTDLHNIDIEFGIEAKGFILSLKMMEAMIEKGYIFKDMLNDKVFDAVMIFNGNLENTIVTNDIKIKIEDGKIQLIKG